MHTSLKYYKKMKKKKKEIEVMLIFTSIGAIFNIPHIFFCAENLANADRIKKDYNKKKTPPNNPIFSQTLISQSFHTPLNPPLSPPPQHPQTNFIRKSNQHVKHQ